jgi:transcription elongation GreA/GreB family factor
MDVSAGKRDLKELAARGALPELEAAWLDALTDPPPAQHFLDALAAMPDGLRGSAAVSLLLLLLEACERAGRPGDVLLVARTLYPYRQQKLDLREKVKESLQGLYGKEPWFEQFRVLSAIDAPRGDLLDALARFDKLCRYVPGSVVYHRSGWGEGLVVDHDLAQGGLHVEFRLDKSRRFMPFTTALDVLTVLDTDDLRARLLVDLDGLKRLAEERPEELLHAVCRLHKGRAGVKEIRQWLEGPVVEEKSWAGWWKKAKVAASRDPYLAVDNPARPVFILRQRALTPVDELRGALERAPTLTAVLAVARGPLSLDPAPEVKELLLARLQQGLDAPAPVALPRPGAAGGGESARQQTAARVEATLMLARHGALPRERAAAIVDEAVKASSFAALADALPDAGLRRDALEAFVAARPQLWSDALLPELAELSPQTLDFVADRLLAAGRGDALANRFHIFLLTPSRWPNAVMRLAKRWEAGMFDKVEGAPELDDVAMGILHLAETQAPRAARGDKPAKEVMRQLEELLLAPKTGILKPFAQRGARGDLAAALGVLQRCKTMPDNVVSGLHVHLDERFPDLRPKDETPFWERGGIWCTKAGIARRQEEYRVLIHEKIPANSADIGRAASYGDLSENFEWTAAIEQQRQLTEKAAAMEAELKLAQAIEDAHVETGIVGPGTRVTFEQDGQTQTVTILGPWDMGEGIISYRAPLAAGMLGSKAGDTVQVELPGGQATVKVVSIEAKR